MKLIKRLIMRLSKNGKSMESWGVFECPIDNIEVEMRLSDGYKCKSCGCNKNKNNNYGFKHGETKTRLHSIWTGMKTRCLNSKHVAYKDYGGRGITICPEWTNDYTKFRDWALSNGYADDLVIDRKDPDENYEPSNCRWITVLESNRNKTNTITLEIANEIRALHKTGNYSQRELADKYNMEQTNIFYIVNNKTWKLYD